VSAAPGWPAGYALLQLDDVDSTNAEARRRAEAGAPGPLWISAARQNAGRGRRGNVWQSPPGNLYATLLIRPGKPVAECAQLSFAAALAVSDMLAGFAPSAAVAVKWPNDVLLDGRKIAGLLLEGEADWLAIGIGVNLREAPARAATPAVSLAALMVNPPVPNDALLSLAARMARWYEIWRSEGFARLRDTWLARAAGLGGEIRVRLPRGELTGRFRGLNDAGALLLDLPGGQREISAGEVFF
jgi:BirA family transcriptional regulator, biotin operon repressor / biotin---[acetyl-CoA-carboxylase] ligase